MLAVAAFVVIGWLTTPKPPEVPVRLFHSSSNLFWENKPSRSFSRFSQSFSAFSSLFGPVFTHSDTFGYIGCFRQKTNQKKVEKKSNFLFEKFREAFRCFREVSGELEVNGPQNQLGHQILLQIHLS